MLPYLFLFLFLAAAVLNLVSVGRYKILFGVTKPMLLLFLMLYCLFYGKTPDPLLLGAFFACFLGDVLLMLKGDLWFAVGGVSFFIGHLLLIFLFARQVEPGRLPFAVLIPAAVVYAGIAGAVMVRTFRSSPPLMRVPTLLYLLANAAMNLFALTRALQSPGVWQAVSFAGAALFFLSDCSLFLRNWDRGKKRFFKTDFFVMLTYISGVLLIALGLLPVGG